MPKKQKSKGGRPTLGALKRVQQSITFRPDLYEKMQTDMRSSGISGDGRTHNLTLSQIVETALDAYYAKSRANAKGK